MQHQHGVLDAAGHGAEFVERPAQRHRARARHPAVRRTQPGNAAAHGRAHDAAAGLAPDREAHQSRRSGCARARARSRRSFFEQPRVHGLSAEPDIVERQSSEAQLGDQHRTRLMKTLHDRGVLGGHAVSEGLGAVGSRDAGSVKKIFGAPWDAVQRPAVFARGDLGIGLFGLRQRQLTCKRDDATQLGIEALQSFEIKIGEPL